MGLLEAADPIVYGAGEGAFGVAEQLAFHQIFGDRRAIDRNHFRPGPGAGHVNRARHHFLAGSGLPGDQHGGPARADQPDHGMQKLHGAAFADDQVAPGLLELRRIPGELRGAFELESHQLDQLLGGKPFRDMEKLGDWRSDQVLIQGAFRVVKHHRDGGPAGARVAQAALDDLRRERQLDQDHLNFFRNLFPSRRRTGRDGDLESGSIFEMVGFLTPPVGA